MSTSTQNRRAPHLILHFVFVGSTKSKFFHTSDLVWRWWTIFSATNSGARSESKAPSLCQFHTPKQANLTKQCLGSCHAHMTSLINNAKGCRRTHRRAHIVASTCMTCATSPRAHAVVQVRLCGHDTHVVGSDAVPAVAAKKCVSSFFFKFFKSIMSFHNRVHAQNRLIDYQS